MKSPGAAAWGVKARKTPATMLVILLLCTCLRATGQRISTVDVGRSTYYISSQSPYNAPLSWYLAYQYCRTIGMELLTENTQEEAESLHSFLSSNGYADQSFWTSGNQLGSSQWLWMTSGLPYNTSFSYWAVQQEPLATSSDDSCMLLQTGKWRTASCTQPHHLICQLTRCFFFNYVRSNTPSTQADDARSTRETFLAPGVRRVSPTAPGNNVQPTTSPPPARRTHRPITANRVIHFPTIVPLVLTNTSNATEQVQTTAINLASRKHIGQATAVHAVQNPQLIADVHTAEGDKSLEQHQSFVNNSSLPDSHALSDNGSTARDQQVLEDAEAPTQEDLDELLRQTAESNTIGGAAAPTLSKQLQPPSLHTQGAEAPHNTNARTESNDNSNDGTTTRTTTVKTTNAGVIGGRTRLDQLGRKEVFSWALLPDSPQS
ncbi:C-type lectin-like [Trinorchestia longiramus]|nr:C-type lectin-like [Trinorchestia longiramus]